MVHLTNFLTCANILSSPLSTLPLLLSCRDEHKSQNLARRAWLPRQRDEEMLRLKHGSKSLSPNLLMRPLPSRCWRRIWLLCKTQDAVVTTSAPDDFYTTLDSDRFTSARIQIWIYQYSANFRHQKCYQNQPYVFRLLRICPKCLIWGWRERRMPYA